MAERPTYTGGRVVYDGRHAVTGERHTFTGAADHAPSEGAHHGDGGFLGGVGHFFKRGATNLKDVAVHTPGGLYAIGNAARIDFENAALHPSDHSKKPHLLPLAEEMAQSTADTLKHPLRNPGYTALTVLPFLNTGAKAAAAGQVARSGGTAGEVAKALVTRPYYEPRTLRRGEAEIKIGSSQSALGAGVQRVYDKGLQAAAKREGRVGRVADKKLSSKIGKTLAAESKVVQDVHRAEGASLIAIGRKLKPHEQKALQIVAEETPVEGRITATAARVTGAKTPKARRRHQAELDLLHKAKPLVATRAGKPVLAGPSAAKLNGVLDRMRQVAGSRETLLKQLGLLTDEAIQARKTNAGRVALGATYETPTPSKLGVPSRALKREQSRLESLRRRREQTLGKEADWRVKLNANQARLAAEGRPQTMVRSPMSEAHAQSRLAELDQQWEQLVGKVGEAVNPYTKEQAAAETRSRNTMRGRMAQGKKPATGRSIEGRVGGGSKTIKTISQEVRDLAEQKIADIVAKHPDHPVAQRAKQLMDERDLLHNLLNARAEAPLTGEKPPALPAIEQPAKLAKGYEDAPHPPLEPSNPFTNRLVLLGHALEAQQSRVGRMEAGAAARMKPTGFIGAEHFQASPDAVRIPDVATRAGRTLNRPSSVGAQGTIGHPRLPGSVTHPYTGALREHGVRREDTTQLVGESGLEAAKFAGLLHVHDFVRQAVSPVPTSPTDIAVRLELKAGRGAERGIGAHDRMPLDVRRFLDDPQQFFEHATPEETASMFDKVRARLFIDPKRLTPAEAVEFQQLAEQGKIGWVPREMLGELAKPHLPYTGKAIKTVDAINNASRFAILYLKPAYAIPNLLGNAALNILQQGFAAPINLGRAATLDARLGPEIAARIDALMGEGFARSLSAHGRGPGAVVVDRAANFWSKGVDIPFRRSTILYAARRAGYTSPSELERLLVDPAHQQRLIDITERANREIIDYANLGPTEREIVRRVVFFYPWVKGSTVYAGRFLREHPVKAAAVGAIGATGQRHDLPAPSYLEGSFDVGGRLANPSSAAIFQTPAQVGQAVAGLAGGDVGRVGDLANFLSPAAATLVAAATRRDRSGFPYKPDANVGDIAYDQLVKQTPQFVLGQRISDAVHGRGQDRLYPPNVRDAVIQFLIGGIAPRKYNRSKLEDLRTNERARR